MRNLNVFSVALDVRCSVYFISCCFLVQAMLPEGFPFHQFKFTLFPSSRNQKWKLGA